MEELSYTALRQLQWIHDFPCVPRLVDSSDSPMLAVWSDLIDRKYIIECQCYSECGDEIVQNGMGYDITPMGNAYLLEFSKQIEGMKISDIYLDKKEYRLLKKLRDKKDVPIEDSVAQQLVLSGVVTFKFIKKQENPCGCAVVCNITNTGIRYIAYRREEFFKTWTPIGISIMSLIFSIAALLSQ